MEILVSVPCVIHEDDHLLAVNKPAGINTHAPAPHAGEGIYDWLRHREPRWARLSLIHRLDKETSGVLLFSKTALANRSLTEQFTRGSLKKIYLLLTDQPVRQKEFAVTSTLIRAGEKYVMRPAHAGHERAETRFRILRRCSGGTLVQAEPVTGRTHQIRVHAAASGFPIVGDVLYGGSPQQRVCLHAHELTLKHPATGNELTLTVPMDFFADSGLALRSALIDWRLTDACRLIHGGADGSPGWSVDRLGDFLLSQSERALSEAQRRRLAGLLKFLSCRGASHKITTRDTGKSSVAQAPLRILGEAAPEEVVVFENGVRYALSFSSSGSVGLFLDQRDNRRRLLTGHVAAGFSLRGEDDVNPPLTSPGGWEGAGVGSSPPLAGMQLLNAFAYTCGFSVCAARAGARTTSLDLSRNYLAWGKRNFALNNLNLSGHEFLSGDVFDWLRRMRKTQRQFDLIVLDPPTFSQSKEHGVFRAEKDFGELIGFALPLLKARGVLFASTNAARLRPEAFLQQITSAVAAARRGILRQHYAPQPPDFPITRGEPAHLKTFWLRVG